MMDALRAMPPGFMPESASPSLVSHRVPGHARGVLGSVSVLSQLVELAPVVVTGSGVTIVVVVAILVVAAAVSLANDGPTKEECDEEWKKAGENAMSC
jgi:hypothetical protein